MKKEEPEKSENLLKIGDVEIRSFEPLGVMVSYLFTLLKNKNVRELLDIEKKKKILSNSPYTE